MLFPAEPGPLHDREVNQEESSSEIEDRPAAIEIVGKMGQEMKAMIESSKEQFLSFGTESVPNNYKVIVPESEQAVAGAYAIAMDFGRHLPTDDPDHAKPSDDYFQFVINSTDLRARRSYMAVLGLNRDRLSYSKHDITSHPMRDVTQPFQTNQDLQAVVELERIKKYLASKLKAKT